MEIDYEISLTNFDVSLKYLIGGNKPATYSTILNSLQHSHNANLEACKMPTQ